MKDYVSKHKDKKCLFVGSVGDNFYDKGLKDDNHWKTQWLDRYGTNDPSSSLHNIPWLAVLGNHDYGNDDWGCGCDKGCKQFNGPHRPAGTENFWMPSYFWSYYIPVVDVEIIGIDTNQADVGGLGGNGWGGGAKDVYNNCGGFQKVAQFLADKKLAGETHLDKRGEQTTAKTVLIMQHYDGPPIGKQYLDRFRSKNPGHTSVLSAYGHAHVQDCNSANHSACELILTGGGGGCISGESHTLGFVAVHLTDDGGYTTNMFTDGETSVSRAGCGDWAKVNANMTVVL